jgi:soluble lytic murein transglycosylase
VVTVIVNLGRRTRRYLLWAAALLGIVILLLNSAWFWRLFYPFPHQELVSRYSRQFEVDPYLVAAIIRVESKFHSQAESQAGARGLMQIMPETARWAAEQMLIEDYDPDRLYEPEFNIRIGVWYLANLTHEFRGNIVLVVAAYNGGRGNVRQWLEDSRWSGDIRKLEEIPYPETRRYVQDVMFNYQMYKRIYG